MERWKTQCPHCGEYSEITFDQIRFTKEEGSLGDEKTYKVTSLYYVCPMCGSVSSEAEMKRQPSRWEAANPDAYERNHTRSFWLSSWVSPWASWESTIQQYLHALGDSKKLQVVYNTRFGQLWEDRGDIEDEDTVMARREDYGTCEDGTPVELPDGVLCLTCGVDTQDDRLEYEVVGYGHFGETWGIKKGIIMGRPDADATWAVLDNVINHTYRFKNGVGLPVSLTFVDEGGHFTQDVRRQCLARQGRRVFAIKGRGGSDIPYTSPPKKQKIVVNSKAIGMCWVYEIGVDAGKTLIMDNIRVKSAGPKYCHFPRRDDYGSDYFKSLLSEHLVYKEKSRNRWQWEKIPGHERNEALDCRDYANAAEKSLSPNYDALEAKLREAAANQNRPAPSSRAGKKSRPAAKKRDKFYDEW